MAVGAKQDAHTLRVPPVFLMICMLSRLLLPFSLSTASTASLAKCSLSCVKIFELQHGRVHDSEQHEVKDEGQLCICMQPSQIAQPHIAIMQAV